MAERIAMRTAGPFHLRLILQPMIAIMLGFRDGLGDAKNNRPPYGLEILLNNHDRKHIIKQGLRSVVMLLAFGFVLHGIVQFLLFERVRIIGAIVAGTILIGLPYTLSRGLTNRLRRILSKKK